MYTLLGICQHPEVLRVIYFFLLILDIVTVIVPIGLIVMLLIDFSKAVIANNEDEQIKSTKLVAKRIMYAVIVFLLPWIISVLMNILDSLNFKVGDYNACLKNAKSGNFEYYDSLLEAERQADEIPKNQNNDKVSSGSSYSKAAATLIQNAKGELGTVGGSKYSGQSDSIPWCAYFVMWNLKKVNISGVGTIYNYIVKDGTTGSCGGACAGDYTANFFNKSNLEFHNSEYYGGNYTPKEGDIIFFWYPSANDGRDWNKSQSEAIYADHIGFVEYSSNGTIHTIEGNSGSSGSAKNSVKEKVYNSNSSIIMGYGSWYK